MTSMEKWIVVLPPAGATAGTATVLGGPFSAEQEAQDFKATLPTATGLRARVIQTEPGP